MCFKAGSLGPGAHWLSYTSQLVSSGKPLSLPPITGVAGVCQHAWPFVWVLGVKLGTLCFHSWVISLATYWIIIEQVIISNSKKLLLRKHLCSPFFLFRMVFWSCTQYMEVRVAQAWAAGVCFFCFPLSLWDNLEKPQLQKKETQAMVPTWVQPRAANSENLQTHEWKECLLL